MMTRYSNNIRVELLDSRDEFRPGRSGGSVDWTRLVSGVLLFIFGLICVFCPLDVLMGIVSFAAFLVIVAGVIGVVSYIRSRDTLFAQSGWNLVFSVLITATGIGLFAFPMIGVAFSAWLFGVGFVLFGAMQLIAGRRFSVIGAGVGAMVGISGVLEIILGVLLCIFPGYLGVFLGLFVLVHSVDMIVFSLPIGRDHTNTLW